LPPPPTLFPYTTLFRSVLHEHDARAVAPGLVGPHARDDVLDRVDDVLVAVVAHLSVRTLGGVAADRQRGVDEEVEPVHRLLDARSEEHTSELQSPDHLV